MIIDASDNLPCAPGSWAKRVLARSHPFEVATWLGRVRAPAILRKVRIELGNPNSLLMATPLIQLTFRTWSCNRLTTDVHCLASVMSALCCWLRSNFWVLILVTSSSSWRIWSIFRFRQFRAATCWHAHRRKYAINARLHVSKNGHLHEIWWQKNYPKESRILHLKSKSIKIAITVVPGFRDCPSAP